MRKIVVWAAIGALALSGIHCLGSSQAGYPLAPDVEGSMGVLRPRMPLVDVASAIDKAFSYFGRPYDFNFDFGTDDQLVCSELVLKSYEPRTEKGPGLRIPYLVVAGRRVGLPTEIVRQFGAEQGTETRQLDFVHFLDGREKGKNALVGDAKGFAESVNRPKWDVAQE